MTKFEMNFVFKWTASHRRETTFFIHFKNGIFAIDYRVSTDKYFYKNAWKLGSYLRSTVQMDVFMLKGTRGR